MTNLAGQIARQNAPRRTAMAMPDYLEKLSNTLPSKARTTKPVTPIVAYETIHGPKQLLPDEARRAELERKLAEDIEAMKAQQEKLRARLMNLIDYRRHPQRPKRLLKLLAKLTDKTVDEIYDISRHRGIVPIRQIAMWIIHRNCIDAHGERIGWCAMGRFFRRDHATVMHSVRKVESTRRLMQQALDLELKLLMMEREIYADNTSSEMVENGGEYVGDSEGAEST